jgi:hypothetical protein
VSDSEFVIGDGRDAGGAAEELARRFAAVQAACDPAMAAGAEFMAAEVREELNQPGSGVIYPRGKGRTHQASAPGEPPAPDTHALAGSIGVEKRGDSHYAIGPTTDEEKAASLELGSATILPRPYLAPAMERAAPTVLEMARAALAAAAGGDAFEVAVVPAGSTYGTQTTTANPGGSA